MPFLIKKSLIPSKEIFRLPVFTTSENQEYKKFSYNILFFFYFIHRKKEGRTGWEVTILAKSAAHWHRGESRATIGQTQKISCDDCKLIIISLEVTDLPEIMLTVLETVTGGIITWIVLP